MDEEQIAELFPEKPFKIYEPRPVQLLLPSLRKNGNLRWSNPQYYHHSDEDIRRFNKVYNKALEELKK